MNILKSKKTSNNIFDCVREEELSSALSSSSMPFNSAPHCHANGLIEMHLVHVFVTGSSNHGNLHTQIGLPSFPMMHSERGSRHVTLEQSCSHGGKSSHSARTRLEPRHSSSSTMAPPSAHCRLRIFIAPARSQVAEQSLHVPHAVHAGNITVVVVTVVVEVVVDVVVDVVVGEVVLSIVVVTVVVVSVVVVIVVVVEVVVVVVVVELVALDGIGHSSSPQTSVSIASVDGHAPLDSSTIPLMQTRSRLRTPAAPHEQVCEHCDHCAQLSQIGHVGEQSSCSDEDPGHVSDALPSSNPA